MTDKFQIEYSGFSATVVEPSVMNGYHEALHEDGIDCDILILQVCFRGAFSGIRQHGLGTGMAVVVTELVRREMACFCRKRVWPCCFQQPRKDVCKPTMLAWICHCT